MKKINSAFAYLLILPVAVVVATLVQFLALLIPNPLFRLSNIIGMLIYFGPSFLVGAIIFLIFARARHAKGLELEGLSGHLISTVSLWTFVALLLWYNISWSSLPENETGYGLVAPLFIWPMLAALGGIAGDIISRLMALSPRRKPGLMVS